MDAWLQFIPILTLTVILLGVLGIAIVTSRNSGGANGDGPTGIGGWLILPAITVALYPVSTSLALWDAILVSFATPSSELTGKLLLDLEIFVDVALIFFSSWVAYLFFRKMRGAPRAYIWLIVATVAVTAGAILTVLVPLMLTFPELLPALLADSSAVTATTLGGVIAYALVWIPYFLRSRRVRNTFTR